MASNAATVTVTVTAVNDAPVAVDDTATTAEDTAVTIAAAALLGNDTDLDGDALTIASVTSGAGGTAVLNADGTVTFTPALNFTGAASFSYTATDGTLASNAATVTVTVTAVNDAPVAVDDTATTAEDTAVTIAAATLLGNDTDLDGDALTIASVDERRGRHGRAERRRHGDVHAGGQLHRRRELQLHGDRRQPGVERRDGDGDGDGGERRAGGGR